MSSKTENAERLKELEKAEQERDQQADNATASVTEKKAITVAKEKKKNSFDYIEEMLSNEAKERREYNERAEKVAPPARYFEDIHPFIDEEEIEEIEEREGKNRDVQVYHKISGQYLGLKRPKKVTKEEVADIKEDEEEGSVVYFDYENYLDIQNCIQDKDGDDTLIYDGKTGQYLGLKNPKDKKEYPKELAKNEDKL
jgi:hypothetical protein